MSGTIIGIVLAVLATVVEGFGQIFLKKSALLGGAVGLGGGRAVWIGLGIAFFVVEAGIYSGALHYLDVSVAYPIGSLSFVAVTILSQWMLGERINASRWAGVVLILAGAGLVAVRA